MGATATPDDREPVAAIRASDAERDATAGRLSAATGDGRLTLEEFSQRMKQATAARTRADLDRLVADLPAPDSAAGGVVASQARTAVLRHVSPVSVQVFSFASSRAAGGRHKQPNEHGWPSGRRSVEWTGPACMASLSRGETMGR